MRASPSNTAKAVDLLRTENLQKLYDHNMEVSPGDLERVKIEWKLTFADCEWSYHRVRKMVRFRMPHASS